MLPYLFGATGWLAVVIATVLVGLALLGTGAVVGVLSGASPLKRALRQLGIGYGAAGVTYALGLLFSTAGLWTAHREGGGPDPTNRLRSGARCFIIDAGLQSHIRKDSGE